MLIDDPRLVTVENLYQFIAEINGNSTETKHLSKGVYEIGYFPGFPFYPGLKGVAYGVCDNPDQVLAHHPEIQDPSKMFLVTLTPIRRENQEEEGGWRWHKWGEYIGDQTPTCEYLYDEPEIELVYCYQVFERTI